MLCGAHHLRELVGIGELTGQDWPTRLGDLLVEMNVAVNEAKTGGKTSIPARRLAAYRRRYRALVTEGMGLHPAPPATGKQGRPRLGSIASERGRRPLVPTEYFNPRLWMWCTNSLTPDPESPRTTTCWRCFWGSWANAALRTVI